MRDLSVDGERLLRRIALMAEIGALPGGGCRRLALTDEDRRGRDLLCGWMTEIGLGVVIDAIGNITGRRPGEEDGPPVMIGSHIDTVATGGRYDGVLGVLAGLEVVETLNRHGVRTRKPLAVAAFTNEEGARFAPDMMGSAVHQGSLALDAALGTIGVDGAQVGAELSRIGYAGPAPVGVARAAAFLELHIEQGPILEREGVAIGVVEGVQGISWTEVAFEGVSNHAGTTPMAMRHDAGHAAAALAVAMRAAPGRIGGAQIATVGRIVLEPNLVNVIARRAELTVDLRNTDDDALKQAEAILDETARAIAAAERLTVTTRRLARFAPVAFDPAVVSLVEEEARARGLSTRRMPSGAGHDAQMFVPHCPAGMIFVPSIDGVSHNVAERTDDANLVAGANVLLGCALRLAEAMPAS